VAEVEDGAVLELAIRLPPAWPLKPAEVECRRKVRTGFVQTSLICLSMFRVQAQHLETICKRAGESGCRSPGRSSPPRPPQCAVLEACVPRSVCVLQSSVSLAALIKAAPDICTT